MKKSVAIIGAGPSGLVAAKTFLRCRQSPFDVTVFDKQDRVGGLWAVAPGDEGRLLNPQMPTNLSRFTVAFSDLCWQSIGIPDIPIFPRAWQVGKYLEKYAQTYIPQQVLRVKCNVTSAECVQGRWKLRWKEEGDDDLGEQTFDYMIIASGFFAAPRPFQDPGIGMNKHRMKLVHSSRARSLQDVVPDSWDGTGNIVVIGGSMSGAEAATSLAFQLSDMRHAPGSKRSGDARVIHVMPRHIYAVPPFVPTGPDSSLTTFAPTDLCFYDLARRPQGPIRAGSGLVPLEKAQASHRYMQGVVGDQRDLNASSLVAETIDVPMYVALTAGGMYSNFVQSGAIQPRRGRVTRIEPRERSSIVTVSNGTEETEIDNVIGAVYATGYTPMPALKFLPADVKRQLELDPESYRLPAILQNYQTSNSQIPNLGFVGFYEGPYWTVAEMQARLLAKKWAAADVPPTEEEDSATTDKLKTLREAMHSRNIQVPQYWNGDYIGLVEEMADELDIERNDVGFGQRAGPVCPARYCDDGCDSKEAQLTIKDLQTIMAKSATQGLFVARAAFRAMHGVWTMQREIVSALATFPSGTFSGTAHFHPRVPTDPAYDGEYLYIEVGEFATSQGFKMPASRRYVYRYQEVSDRITTWFVKEDGLTVDYLFLDLEQRHLNASLGTCISESRHHCAPDIYDGTYQWFFKHIALERFHVVYKVVGPKKDYVSTTSFAR